MSYAEPSQRSLHFPNPLVDRWKYYPCHRLWRLVVGLRENHSQSPPCRPVLALALHQPSFFFLWFGRKLCCASNGYPSEPLSDSVYRDLPTNLTPADCGA